MKDQVKQAIFAYFKSIGKQGGKTVQPGDLLPRHVKSNLHHELKPFYDQAVQELAHDGLLVYTSGTDAVPGQTLGSIAGYRITEKGAGMIN